MSGTEHTLVLVGVMGFMALACLLAGGFFVHVWRERRSDAEYLLFGVSNLAMASYIAGSATAYLHAAQGADGAEVVRYINVALVSSIIGVVFLLHFGVEHARLPYRRQALWVAYGLAVLFTLAVLTDNWWAGSPPPFRPARLGPIAVPYLSLRAGWLGNAFFLAAPLTLATAGLLYGLGQRRVKGPLAIVWVSTAVLLLGGLNDSLGLGAGFFPTMSLLPFTFSAFGLAVSLTLVSRYGRLATELEQRTGELNERSEQLVASLKDLSETRSALLMNRQLAVVGGLIEELAAELNEPLQRAQRALDGMVERDGSAARDGSVGQDAEQDALDALERQTDRINRLVSDLLSFARPIALDREEVAIEPLLQHCLVLTEAYPEVDVQVSCELPWPSIHADRARLGQVFEHLVHNALAAVRDGGEIAITVCRMQHSGRPHVMVEVQDTGEGMSEEALRAALAPFFTTRSDGTGFGLPICKRVVETHGGELTVASQLGSGTTVTMLLPIEPPVSVPSSLHPLSSGAGFDL